MAKRQVPDCGLCFFSLGYLDFSSNPLTTLSDMARFHQDFGEIVNIFCRQNTFRAYGAAEKAKTTRLGTAVLGFR